MLIIIGIEVLEWRKVPREEWEWVGRQDGNFVRFEGDSCGWQNLNRKYRIREHPASVERVSEEVPREKWPRSILWLHERRKEGEVGAGDTLERLLGAGGRWAKRLAYLFRVDCGCDTRKARMNRRYRWVSDNGA